MHDSEFNPDIYDASMNMTIDRINALESDTIGCRVCMKDSAYTPFIRFGDSTADTFGWVINKRYTTNRFTIPHQLTSQADDTPMNSRPFFDSYLCPTKYQLDVQCPYYRGESYSVIMEIELTKSQLVACVLYGYIDPVFAHGINSNCNTVFIDALSPHMTFYQKTQLVHLIMVSHGKNIS